MSTNSSLGSSPEAGVDYSLEWQGHCLGYFDEKSVLTSLFLYLHIGKQNKMIIYNFWTLPAMSFAAQDGVRIKPWILWKFDFVFGTRQRGFEKFGSSLNWIGIVLSWMASMCKTVNGNLIPLPLSHIKTLAYISTWSWNWTSNLLPHLIPRKEVRMYVWFADLCRIEPTKTTDVAFLPSIVHSTETTDRETAAAKCFSLIQPLILEPKNKRHQIL